MVPMDEIIGGVSQNFYQIFIFWLIFSIDLCRVETAVDSTPPIQSKNKRSEKGYLLFFLTHKSNTDFPISFSEEMVDLFDFLFERT